MSFLRCVLFALCLTTAGACGGQIEAPSDLVGRWDCTFQLPDLGGYRNQQGQTFLTFNSAGRVDSSQVRGGRFSGNYVIANGQALISVTRSQTDGVNPIQRGEQGTVSLNRSGDEIEIDWSGSPRFNCTAAP